ncbi:DUF4926 domain-containing protein [Glycomyces salinus]|uniref:DUF4926 domain-containing protein n=1 Tax=Glycomyces salinus TaxID=980294 RepID=UPI0018EBEDF8|nr:DUF4926 domain-containing protein [Glycomyces salinus]
MSRNSAPQFRRMPGSAILTMLLGLYVLVAVFAVRKNTLAWCNRVPERGSGFLSIDRDPEDEEEPNFSDRVELLVVLEEYGLRSGAVGTIVDMHDDPTSFEVEFVDDRTETTTRVSLRPDQLRFIPESR